MSELAGHLCNFEVRFDRKAWVTKTVPLVYLLRPHGEVMRMTPTEARTFARILAVAADDAEKE